MGDMDDGMHDVENLPVQFLVMYQPGYTDGYTHFYDGPLYESRDAADFTSKKAHNMHAIESRVVSTVVIDGRVYIIDGPYKTVKDVEMETEIRSTALSKLTETEKRILGLK